MRQTTPSLRTLCRAGAKVLHELIEGIRRDLGCGVLLIVAVLVIPAAMVRRFSASPERMAAGAATAGIVSMAGGLFASAEFDTPSGPSIVVTALALFVVTRIRRPRPAGGVR